MKRCFKCKRLKRIDQFYKHSQMADGHLGKCKSCAKKDAAQRYADKRDYVRAYEKLRSQNPERKAKKAEYQRRRRAKHPGKDRAKNKVGNAIRDGRLKRLPCQVCGEPAEAHHEDYRKPLDVQWLCFKHHRELKHGQTVG